MQARRPRSQEVTHRCGFLGKPLRVIFRSRHQDAQNPPSPRVGEGGRGMRGKDAPECKKPLISPKKSTLESQDAGASARGRDAREPRK